MSNIGHQNLRDAYVLKLKELVTQAAQDGVVLSIAIHQAPGGSENDPLSQNNLDTNTATSTMSIEGSRAGLYPSASSVSASMFYHGKIQKEAGKEGDFPRANELYFPAVKKVEARVFDATDDRLVDQHQVHGDFTPIIIAASDNKSPAGAYNEYSIFNSGVLLNKINFQNGPPPVKGYNGVTIEQLFAIGVHRLARFQEGPFHCADNAEAIHLASGAIKALQRRTVDRIAREVKDTDKP